MDVQGCMLFFFVKSGKKGRVQQKTDRRKTPVCFQPFFND